MTSLRCLYYFFVTKRRTAKQQQLFWLHDCFASLQTIMIRLPKKRSNSSKMKARSYNQPYVNSLVYFKLENIFS